MLWYMCAETRTQVPPLILDQLTHAHTHLLVSTGQNRYQQTDL